MEKCTYCIQRISAARRSAERTRARSPTARSSPPARRLPDAGAISFGDLHRTTPAVAGCAGPIRATTRCSAHLGTRPRTTYLAGVRNPSPSLEDGAHDVDSGPPPDAAAEPATAGDVTEAVADADDGSRARAGLVARPCCALPVVLGFARLRSRWLFI